MPWHPQAMTNDCRQTARLLLTLPQLKKFYLAGGTALALQFGHRVSMDLDFFSPDYPLDPSHLEALKTGLRKIGRFAIRKEEEGTLHVVILETAVSFLRYPYPALKPLLSWEGLAVASYEDIALMKIGAIIGRGAKKDFIDLYTISQKIPLTDLLKLSEQKFKHSADFYLQAAKALVYFDDAESDPSPRLLKPARWPQIKKYFEQEVPKAVKVILKSS
ncbi:MAG: nucleotidyl transferase AbiEii/AbiGii toxin family protein [Elusimicrobia bacterium]|nr:nucleotidyl transferase AbiEii/AbiGii toxin family protein [Elusimicrobiota bacterium]